MYLRSSSEPGNVIVRKRRILALNMGQKFNKKVDFLCSTFINPQLCAQFILQGYAIILHKWRVMHEI
jgi:hypothetical protein